MMALNDLEAVTEILKILKLFSAEDQLRITKTVSVFLKLDTL